MAGLARPFSFGAPHREPAKHCAPQQAHGKFSRAEHG
jgi:hypothetical protein